MNKSTLCLPLSMPVVRPASDALGLEKVSKRRRLGESSTFSNWCDSAATNALIALPDLQSMPSLELPFPTIAWDESDEDEVADISDEEAAAVSQSLFSKPSDCRGAASATLLRSKAMFCLLECQAAACRGRKEEPTSSLPFLLVG